MRVENWDFKLIEFVKSRLNTPFKRGEHDCILFAADCINIITGNNDIAEKYRGYKTRKEAEAIIESEGGLEQLVTNNIGLPILIKLIQRGDVVLVEHEGIEGIGVNVGNQIAVTGTKGIIFIPLSTVKVAWRI